LRHALCALNPETADTDFTWDQAEELTRTGLLGAIANPAYRVAALLWKRFGGAAHVQTWNTEASADRIAASRALDEIGAAIRSAQLRKALGGVHALGAEVNRRLAQSEPWNLPDGEAILELTKLLPALDAIGIAAWPIVPETARRIRGLFGREPIRRWGVDESPPAMEAPPEHPLRTGITPRSRP
jgi:methionyl-tRNA synthetase